jgi:hypothetical protein
MNKPDGYLYHFSSPEEKEAGEKEAIPY